MNEDIKYERLEELNAVMKHMEGESDRGVTLIISAQVEGCLRRIIETVLIDSKMVAGLFDGPYAPFGSLSGKTQAAYLMGLITKGEMERIDALRKVRNVFAHEAAANFEHPKIKKVCDSEVVDRTLVARDAFLHLALNIMLPVLYRDLDIQEWKRAELTQEMASSWLERASEGPS